MKIAFVYDRVTKWGGAERVLLALHRLWPEAPLYTAVYDQQRAPWAKVFRVHTSFLQRIPFAKTHHEWFPWLTPLAFETFSFDEFDVVISITSAEAKTIITKPKTKHICYCLTPTRYLWSGFEEYKERGNIGGTRALTTLLFRLWAPTLRQWDEVASARPDYYVGISQLVKERIARYYKRPSDVIYPPVNFERFAKSTKAVPGTYFLAVGRLVSYKRMDIVVDACARLAVPLVVIGDGYEYKNLKKRAPGSVRFIRQHLTESELVRYYEGCRALIHAAREDFGLVGVEAQAAGRPVIAYRDSGIAETIVDGKTGILFNTQSVQSLMSALRAFEAKTFDGEACRSQAKKFDERVFEGKMRTLVDRIARTTI